MHPKKAYGATVFEDDETTDMVLLFSLSAAIGGDIKVECEERLLF